MSSVISVIVDSPPGNNKNRESTRSWTARARLVHSWAEPEIQNAVQYVGIGLHCVLELTGEKVSFGDYFSYENILTYWGSRILQPR